ncbi:hypothetical protein JCM10212_003034 [Sporobolomyces blumeae]
MLAASYPATALPGPYFVSTPSNRGRGAAVRTGPTKSTRRRPASASPEPRRSLSLSFKPRLSRPALSTAYTTPAVSLASFSDDAGFGDLLNPSRAAFANDAPYDAFSAAQDDDLASNPFADMASSAVSYPSSTQQTSYDQPRSPDTYQSTPFGAPAAPATPANATQSAFFRESAPTPETPAPSSSSAFDYSTYDTSAYTPGSPLAPAEPAPLSPSEQTPFGSPPTSPSLASALYSPATPTHAFALPADASPLASPTRGAAKPDLSALLGEEKPILPSFSKRRERSEGVAGPLGSKIAVLPVSSVGRKPVGGALASLLGIEVEEDSHAASTSTDQKVEPNRAPAEDDKTPVPLESADSDETASLTDVENEAEHPEIGRQDEVVPAAPAPPEDVPLAEPTTPAALETPLPPSPSRAEPSREEPTSSIASASTPPSLSRVPSEAPSAASMQSSTAENVAYESMVSPLVPETDENGDQRDAAWPANKDVASLESQLAASKISPPDDSTPVETTPTTSLDTAPSDDSRPAVETSATSDAAAEPSYSQYIFSDSSSAPATHQPTASTSSPFETPSRGFRVFNGSGDEGGFGTGTDDGDSLRGAYSRSVDVGDVEDAATETGTSSPATERAVERDGSIRSQRETSAPLPPLPSSVVQGSPRSAELGGSLGPSFIITVGDPQKVGNPLNPASQHTVFTVRTRTTSVAFRKSDFSVLRRYSHFVWLYEALVQNNPGVIVPGLPEKHAIGRFGSEFVENRRSGLQAALTKIVSHPMLVGDPDLRLFLESDTFHLDIKQRKIDTPHESKGFLANLSSSISGPKFVEFDEYFENRRNALDTFETQLRSLLTSLSAAAKARSVLQASYAELQSAFLALAESDLSTKLRRAFNEAAALQKKLHDLNEAQAAGDEQIGGLINVVESYARMCASARGVFGARIKAFHAWQAADARLKKVQAEHEKGKRSGRMHSELLPDSVAHLADAERKMLDARHDFDDVSKLTRAEMARFDKEKVDDFRKALEDYADSLATRQREVVSAWQHYHDVLVKISDAEASPPSIVTAVDT